MFPNNHKWLLVFFAGLSLAGVRCTAPSATQRQVTVPHGIWDRSHLLQMELPLPYSNARYLVYLDIRVTKEYPYKYLSVVLKNRTPADTLWLPLLPQQAIRSGQFTDYRFALDTAGWKASGPVCFWELEHHMPNQQLTGIVQAGILMKIQKNGKRQTETF